MFKLLPLIAFAVIAYVGYFAWRQYRGIQIQLGRLVASGVSISNQLTARPVIIYDKARVYLAHADRIDTLSTDNIKEIIVFRSERVENESQGKKQDNNATSHAQLIDNQGVIYRFADYQSAESAIKYFQRISELSRKVRLVITS